MHELVGQGDFPSSISVCFASCIVLPYKCFCFANHDHAVRGGNGCLISQKLTEPLKIDAWRTIFLKMARYVS